jgi:hypothetical protein
VIYVYSWQLRLILGMTFLGLVGNFDFSLSGLAFTGEPFDRRRCPVE